MAMETKAHPPLARDERRLMGGWRDVVEDVQHFAAALKAIPDGCHCNDGPAHLSATCGCCHTVEGQRTACIDCAVLLHTASWRLDALIEDSLRYMPAVGDVLAHVWPADGQERVRDVQRRIAKVASAMTAVEGALGTFAGACALDNLATLRAKTAELLSEVTELADELIPRLPGPPRYST